MDYVHSLRRFLCRLAIHSGTMLHVRYVRHGHAWPAIWDAQRCVYHHCLVMPYVGGESRRKGSPRAIPRIHLNHHNPRGHAPADQLARRARAAWPGRVATVYGAKLEFTATIEELPLLAAWVVAWAAAKVAKDAGGAVELPQPPVALENPPPSDELLAFDYLWTQAAADEYSALRAQRSRKAA